MKLMKKLMNLALSSLSASASSWTAAAVRDFRHSDRDDQQGHRDREETVAEGQGAIELDALTVVGPSRRQLLLHDLAALEA
jgi:hypothetical protein